MTDTEAIQKCISHCAARKDERGRWRAEDKCAAALRGPGRSSVIADHCALAARRIGAWLAKQGCV